MDAELDYEDNPYMVNPVQEKNAHFIQKLIDPTRTLERIEAFLRGQVYDYEKKQYINKFKPEMNELGITWVMSYLHMHLDPLFKLTSYTEDHVNETMKEINKTILNSLTSEAQNWGINPSYSSIRKLADCIEHPIDATLRASIGNLGRGLINSTTSRNENVVVHETKGEQAPLKYSPWGGRRR